MAYKFYREAKRPKRFDPRGIYEGMTKDQGRMVFAASSLDRVFQDGKTLLEPEYSYEVALSAARNEYEAFQVVVAAGETSIENVRIELPDLIHEDGKNRIGREVLSWRTVAYVPTVTPYYPVKYVGKWPDPLLNEKQTSVAGGSFQPFWVTVYVPKQTLAGDYGGRVRVYAGQELIKEIPLKLKVYDFTIPVESRLTTAFDFYGHETYKRYPRRDRETKGAYQARLEAINLEFLKTLLTYRMNPVLNVDPQLEEDLALVDRLRVLGLSSFSIGKRGGTLGNNWPMDDKGIRDLMPLYRTYGEILKLNRFLDFNYIYTWDEGAIGNPIVAKLSRMIHEAYPGLKNMVCYHGFWDPDRDPDWGKDIDIWCFQIDNFVERKMRRLQEKGLEIWMYISGPGGYQTPNLAMDFDSIDYRIIPWLCWKYDIKGFLYWCVNWWPNVDPFLSARNTRWEQNGNGLLFYPGENGPIASLRAEVFRDGMEDYEYFQELLARLKVLKRFRDQKASIDAFYEKSLEVLTVDERIAFSMDSYTRDGSVLKERRNLIARMINEFEHKIRPVIEKRGK